MFIDNIKYQTAMLVALFSLLLAGCGSAQNNKDLISPILDELSHSTCNELPYEICLSAAAARSYYSLYGTEVRYGGERARDFFLRVMTEEEALDAARLFEDRDIEDVWEELIRRESTRGLNDFERRVKTQTKVLLISREFTERVQNVDYGWVGRNHEKLRSTSKECEAKRDQLEWYEVPALNICAAMVMLIELEQPAHHLRDLLPIESRISETIEVARDLFAESAEMGKRLGQEAHLARRADGRISLLW